MANFNTRHSDPLEPDFTVERIDDMAVKITGSGDKYYEIEFVPHEKRWFVYQHSTRSPAEFSGVSAPWYESYKTAEEAVSKVKSMIVERRDELNEALRRGQKGST